MSAKVGTTGTPCWACDHFGWKPIDTDDLTKSLDPERQITNERGASL